MLTKRGSNLARSGPGGDTGSIDIDLRAAAREHYDAVFRFCARRVGLERAADAAQETFLTAQRSLHQFRGDASLRTWIFGIALNQCRWTLRKAKAEPVAVTLVPNMEPAEASPEVPVIDRHVLQQALARLSSEHREVVLLHEADGLTYEEAAKVLDVPVGTVKSRLHHAFAQLRRSLEGGLA